MSDTMIWSNEKFLAALDEAAAQLVALGRRKNADYSTSDPFSNFRMIETLTDGRISAEDGIVVRLSDKLARMARLAAADPAVAEESLEDTCRDMAGYALALSLLRRSRTEMDEMAEPEQPEAAETADAPPSAFEQLKALLERLRSQAGAGGATS